jgi:hypothetical protein
VDQCIFVRGFRVARKSKILSRPKAPAESNPDRLIPIPASPKVSHVSVTVLFWSSFFSSAFEVPGASPRATRMYR